MPQIVEVCKPSYEVQVWLKYTIDKRSILRKPGRIHRKKDNIPSKIYSENNDNFLYSVEINHTGNPLCFYQLFVLCILASNTCEINDLLIKDKWKRSFKVLCAFSLYCLRRSLHQILWIEFWRLLKFFIMTNSIIIIHAKLQVMNSSTWGSDPLLGQIE